MNIGRFKIIDRAKYMEGFKHGIGEGLLLCAALALIGATAYTVRRILKK